MGCVQSKRMQYTPPRGFEKLKLENGYVKGGSVGRPNDAKMVDKDDFKVDDKNVGPVGKGGEVGGRERKITKEGEKGNNVSGRITIKKIGADELVDGWPKWLVDNIPKDVLAGLVPKSADSYDKLAKVGKGTYSNVYKARDRDTGKIVALKKVRFDTAEPESVKFMAREIIILQKLDHPNIIRLEGLATSRMQYSLYLVLEFMQSDLTKVISRPEGRLTEPQVKCYMQQLLSGLLHCHERGILHRDIKGSNLLIDKSGMLKIADFGLANFYQPKQKRPLTSRVVTLWYRAPELLLGSTDYGVGIDLWSAGCLLAEMFMGRPIMPGRTEFFSSSPLACDLSGLPVMNKEDDVPSQSTDRRKSRKLTKKQQSLKNRKGHGRKVSGTEDGKDNLDSSKEENQEESNSRSQDMVMSTTSSASASSSKKLSMSTQDEESSPPSPYNLPFHSNHNLSAKTEAHPNALKNIKNFPLLMASITETVNHIENNRLNRLSRRSMSQVDFRTLDMEKLSKLFGLEEH